MDCNPAIDFVVSKDEVLSRWEAPMHAWRPSSVFVVATNHIETNKLGASELLSIGTNVTPAPSIYGA